MRPGCFEVFLSLSITIPTFLAFVLVINGGWRPASPLWEPLLMCLAATGVILMLVAALALSQLRRR